MKTSVAGCNDQLRPSQRHLMIVQPPHAVHLVAIDIVTDVIAPARPIGDPVLRAIIIDNIRIAEVVHPEKAAAETVIETGSPRRVVIATEDDKKTILDKRKIYKSL